MWSRTTLLGSCSCKRHLGGLGPDKLPFLSQAFFESRQTLAPTLLHRPFTGHSHTQERNRHQHFHLIVQLPSTPNAALSGVTCLAFAIFFGSTPGYHCKLKAYPQYGSSVSMHMYKCMHTHTCVQTDRAMSR